MPRPLSKHGLDRKYKLWRRGKSKTTNNGKSKGGGGSLKHQLRGKERLLAKLPENEHERRTELEASIEELKAQIAQKQETERQRKNAVQSHGIRFLERQRLTRTERTTRKLWEQADSHERPRYEAELRRIALDQVYVAYFPHDVKYHSLFRKGVRVVDEGKAIHKRASVRRRILQQLAKQEVKTVNWIPPDQYKRLPVDWSVDMERETFAATSKQEDGQATTPDDSRFALNTQHSALLEAAEKLDTTLNEQERKEDDQSSESIDSDSDSSSDDDGADPLQSMSSANKEHVEVAKREPSEEDSSDSSSSRSNDSDSSSSSDDSSDEEGNIIVSNANNNRSVPDSLPGEEDDDFLVPAEEDDGSATNVFDKAKQHVPAWDDTTGDKSKGWATQRQRPDQRKRRRLQR